MSESVLVKHAQLTMVSLNHLTKYGHFGKGAMMPFVELSGAVSGQRMASWSGHSWALMLQDWIVQGYFVMLRLSVCV